MLAATLAVYAPALLNGFVWDDTALVLRDPFIRSWRLIPAGFGHFLFADATAADFYRPMQRLLFTFDYAVFAFAPWGYHLMSVLLHGTAAVTLWFLLLEFTGRVRRERRVAGAAALLWVIHPLHTSAVTYVAGSADLLAAVFGFAALKATFLAGRAVSRQSRLVLAGLAALGFLAAMLSKESGAMFLVVALLWLALERKWRRFLWGTGIALAVLAVYLACRLTAVHEPAPSFSGPVPASERPVRMVQALGEYARLVIAPVDLHMERELAQGGAGLLQMAGGGLVLAGFLLWLRWAWRHRPAAVPLLGAGALAFLPISNLFSLNAPIAEHWLYVPLAFLLGAAAVSLARVRSRVLATALCCWAVLLAARTFARQFDWRDERIFVERTIAAGGDSARMWMSLAGVETRAGHLPAARRAAEHALELAPGHPFGRLRLASIAILEKKYDEARALLDQLESEPFFASERLVNLAAIAKAEHPSDYLQLLRRASERKPEDWSLQKRYLGSLAQAGLGGEARARLASVVARQPYRAESWLLLGQFLEAEDQPELARRAYEEAARRDVHLETDRISRPPDSP